VAEAGRTGKREAGMPPESDPGPSIAEDQTGSVTWTEKLESLEIEGTAGPGGLSTTFPSILLADLFAG